MTFDITQEGITIGSLVIRFYSLMILSGIGVGVVIAEREAKRYGDEPEHVVNLAVVGALFAIIGARLYHVFDRNEWPYYSANPGEIIKVWNGGIGIFGGLAGAILGLALYVWWVNRSRTGRRGKPKLRVLRWLDIGAPAFLVGQAVGRWGNFFNQELYGPPTDLPWGIPIDLAHRPLEHAAATHFHPLFLYESILSFIGVAVLLYLGRRFAARIIPGDILLLYFIWYSAERFGLEFLRSGNWMVGSVPTAQVVGTILTALSVALLIWRHKRGHSGALSGGDDGANAGDGEQRSSRGAERRRRRRAESQNDG
jgi:phosphatidylglycerol---prolipoprotein diacylglyceryl transferase